MAPQVPTARASTWSTLSLLIETPNQLSGGEVRPLPGSFGISSPQMVLDGGGRRPDVPYLVSLSARREVVVSGDILVKLSFPALALILLGEPSQIVGGWLTGRRSCEGWVDIIWLL